MEVYYIMRNKIFNIIKKSFLVLLIMLIFIFISNDAKAEEYTLSYGIWTHIEGDILGPDFPIADKNTKIRIEIQNLKIDLIDYESIVFDDTIYIQWIPDGQDHENYKIESGMTSFTQDVKTGNYKDNRLAVWPGDSIESYSFDIKITNLGTYNTVSENDKTSGTIDPQEDCYPNKCSVGIDTKSTYGVKKVRLYRKSSKNGKYKLVKTVYDGSDLDIINITDKGLKPNKKYWYKIKTLGWWSNVWSDYSPAKTYWTCPKDVKGKKRRGNILTWKRSKGVSGYIVDVEYDKFVGYNIFGQGLIDTYTKSYFVKGTKYILKNRNIKVVSIRGYSKHNGKYYCTDGDVVKKKKHLKDNDVTRYRQ